jgi:hypothetical protein
MCFDVSEEHTVVWAQFDLYCFPYEPVHEPRFSGEDSGVIAQDPVTKISVVFRHY